MTPKKCALLTTDTPHHRYFAGRVSALGTMTVILEQNGQHRQTSSRFSRLQDRFEEQFLEGGVSDRFEGAVRTHRVADANGPACLEVLEELRPDLLITFGTGKISPKIYGMGRLSINVHRGILPNYRGLDSDLWALYRGDFGNVGTTLHRLEERVDTGPILVQRRLRLRPGMKAYQMRYHTTALAVEMAGQLLAGLGDGALPAAQPQDLSQGVYLSAIPRLKRWVAARRLEQHVKRLPDE